MYNGVKKSSRRKADFSSFPTVSWKQSKASGKPDFNIIGVNFNDSFDLVNEFAAEFKLTMPLVMGGGGEDSVAMKYGVMAFPTNYVVDSNGTVIATYVGFDEEKIKADLKQHSAND